VAFLFVGGRMHRRNIFSNYSDRRKFQRLRCNVSVWYRVEGPWDVRDKFEDKEIEATTLDISEGGMGILSEHNIPKHAILSLTFVLFKRNDSGELVAHQPVLVKGKVCYSLLSEENKYHLGICFTEVITRHQSEISEFVKAVA